MNKIYHIDIEKIGSNQVRISRDIDEKTREVEWIFNLDGDSEPIVLKEFYTPTKFLIMNWNGLLRAYDAEIKQKIFERDFNAPMDCFGQIARRGLKLYVSHEKDRQNNLTVISLDDFTELSEHPLPKPINIEYFRERKDGKLLYYYRGENVAAEGDDKWFHGFQVVDPDTGESQNFPMQGPPTEDFDRKGPTLDLERNIGAMPNWDDVEFYIGGDGKPRFIAKIDLFDLVTFERIYTIPVREFKTEHLTTSESEDEKTAAILLSDERGESYDDARQTFVDNLNSICFAESEDFIWLCWRAAVVRKISLDGARMSPIIAGVKIPNNTIEGKPFEFRYTHTYLESIHNDGLLLREHSEKYWLSLNGVDLNSEDEIIPVELEGLPEDKQIKTILPEKFNQKIEEMGKIVVEIENLKKENSILNALDQMINLTQDIGSIRQGMDFAFLLRDRKGNTLDEEEFFKQAVRIRGAAEKIRQIIGNFVSYPDADSLYINEEATALCYAVYELAMSDPEYIDTALSYLAVMDFEHDVFCREVLIPHLIEKYGSTPYGPRLRIGVALIDDSEAAEIFLFDDFLDPDSTFRRWFYNGGGKEIPQILEDMAKQGLKHQKIFNGGNEGLADLEAAFRGDSKI